MNRALKASLVWSLSLSLSGGFPISALAEVSREVIVDNAVTTAAATTSAATTTDSATETTGGDSSDSIGTYAGPQLSEAQAAIVVDGQGSVVCGYNINAEYNMASITKIMTAVVALESDIALDSQITCVGSVLDANAQVAGYKEGQTAVFSDLLRVMLVNSANDAAYEIAIAVAGSEDAFVKLMNAKAEELGMTHTHFENCHGLDAEGHHSTVSDLVVLARYAMTNFSFISDSVKLESVTVPFSGVDATFNTTDQFISTFTGALGIKTGKGNTTDCFLGAARQNGLTLYSCVLGCASTEGKFEDTRTLMAYAFSTYDLTDFGSPTTVVAYEPFMYHFGWDVTVSAQASTKGLVDPAAAPVSVSYAYAASDAADSFLLPGQIINVAQWKQRSRVVATATLATSSTFTSSRSGFGLAGKLLEYC